MCRRQLNDIENRVVFEREARVIAALMKPKVDPLSKQQPVR